MILLHGASFGFSSGLAAARMVADYGVQHYVDQRQPWPFGTTAVNGPGLMLGRAGVLDFYLAISDSEATLHSALMP